MTSRHITFHAFCSIKGGVGKSSLAVATAKLLAARGDVPVLIDADLMGTSLADGLRLCAPEVTLRSDGTMDLDAPPTGKHLDAETTARLRNERRDAPELAPPPYLNDALMYETQDQEQDCRVDALLWKHTREDNVLYLPSSPLLQDVDRSLGWLQPDEPFQWVRRFAWVLDALLMQRTDITDIVVDLPPGILGLTHELLVLLWSLGSGNPLPQGYPTWQKAAITWTARPFLITTPDWNALLPSLEYVARQAAKLPSLALLVNRTTLQSVTDLRAIVRGNIDKRLVDLGIEERLLPIDELKTSLGQIFLSRDLLMSEDIQRLSDTLLPGSMR